MTAREFKPEGETETKKVRAVAAGGYALPSGAQFLLTSGDVLDLPRNDAQFLIDNGLAVDASS